MTETFNLAIWFKVFVPL